MTASVGQDTEGVCLWNPGASAGIVPDVDILRLALAVSLCICADFEGEGPGAEAEKGEDVSELHICGGTGVEVIL